MEAAALAVTVLVVAVTVLVVAVVARVGVAEAVGAVLPVARNHRSRSQAHSARTRRPGRRLRSARNTKNYKYCCSSLALANLAVAGTHIEHRSRRSPFRSGTESRRRRPGHRRCTCRRTQSKGMCCRIDQVTRAVVVARTAV